MTEALIKTVVSLALDLVYCLTRSRWVAADTATETTEETEHRG